MTETIHQTQISVSYEKEHIYMQTYFSMNVNHKYAYIIMQDNCCNPTCPTVKVLSVIFEPRCLNS